MDVSPINARLPHSLNFLYLQSVTSLQHLFLDDGNSSSCQESVHIVLLTYLQFLICML